MTLESLKTYIDKEIETMNRFIDTNPYCDDPIKDIKSTRSRCLGAVDYAIMMTHIGFDKINNMWNDYFMYFMNRIEEVRKNELDKKRN